jgi:hypothetical protein
MVTSNALRPANSLKIGKGTIRLEQDEAAIQMFINGMVTGHLSYMVHGRKTRIMDTDIVLLVSHYQNTLAHPLFFNNGFLVGFLTTIAQKGSDQLTNNSFCEGYHDGEKAYIAIGKKYLLSLSELSALISWKHRGANGAYNAGYVAAFLETLTKGIHTTSSMRGENAV